MIRPVAYVAMGLLITTGLCVHLTAKVIVAHGHGPIALVALFASLPLLSRYLD